MSKRAAMAVAASVALAAATMSHAQSTPANAAVNATAQQAVLGQNLSDLWWNAGQSGWGVEIAQMGNALFAVLFVYGPDNRPTWYSADLTAQGSGLYTGRVYASTGGWFGAASFNATQVTRTDVGPISIQVQPDGTLLLMYTVNGVNVAQTLQRQTLSNAILAGTYHVQSSLTASNCTNATDNGTVTGTSTVTVSSTGTPNGLQLQWTNPNGSTCTYSGTQTQNGALASLTGSTYACSTGETGTIDVSGLSNVNGMFGGRLSGTVNSLGCTYNGSFSGLPTGNGM